MDQHRHETAADHLVGNLWFNMDALPLIAGRLETDTMRVAVGGPAAVVYSEMCRILRDPALALSAGSLEIGLREQGFDMRWLDKLQSRVLPEAPETLYSYVDVINNAAAVRHLQQVCGEALEAAKGEDAQAELLTANLMATLSSAKRAKVSSATMQTTISEVRERFQRIKAGTMIWGASTGFATMDKLVRLVNSELVVVAARPSAGKTQIALQICVNRAQQLLMDNDPGQVVIYSAEMSRTELVQRLCCTLGKVNYDRITTNVAQADEWERVEQAMAFLEMLPIEIDDTSGPTVEQVYYRTAMLNAQKPVRLAMSDHTELFSTGKAESETLRVGGITRGFKGIAKTLDIPWINIHQLGREVDDRADKQPQLRDLRYAGEADADRVLFLHRPSYYLKRGIPCECAPEDEDGIAIFSQAKNRNGPIGRFRLAFVEKYALFAELERIHLNE